MFVAHPSLVPLVELQPGSFGEVASPPGPWSDEQAYEYWNACLSKSGLGHLVPVTRRSWLVTLDQLLEPSVLRQVLAAHLRELEHDVTDPEVSSLSGGFALFDGPEPLLLPQCCGDLGNLADWHRATSYRESSAETLWVGHPWIEVAYEAPHLRLQETTEYPKPTDVLRSVTVDPYALAGAVLAARAQLTDCLPQIAGCLAELGFSSAVSAAASILGIAAQGDATSPRS
jgi:hypothetical protein